MKIKLNIPDEFFKGQERSGYYVSPKMKKVWAVQLDLLAEFARVCEKYNLRWWIAWGTLLGAARHKGFIPWDDDVDIWMLRKDYDRLCEIGRKEFLEPYFLQTPENTLYPLAFSKLRNSMTTIIEGEAEAILHYGKNVKYNQGIFIDIFPLHDIPNDEEAFQKLHAETASIMQQVTKHYKYSDGYYPAKKLYKRPIKSLVKLFMGLSGVCPHSWEKYFRAFMDAINSSENSDSERVAALCWSGNAWAEKINLFQSSVFQRSWFTETVYFPFEMLSLPAPSCYEKLLQLRYGNWREFVIIPPHGHFYDTEHPYTYYTEEGHAF